MSHDDVVALVAALDAGLRDAMRDLADRYAALHGSPVASTLVQHADDLSTVTLVIALADGSTIRGSGITRDAALAALTAELA